MSRQIFKEWSHRVLIYFLHRLMCTKTYWRVHGWLHTQTLMVKISFFGGKKAPQRKKKREKENSAQWLTGKRSSRASQADVPLGCPLPCNTSPHDTFLIITIQSLPGHAQTPLWSGAGVLCWLLFSSLLGPPNRKKQGEGRGDSHTGGNCFPWEPTTAMILGFVWNNIGVCRWKMPWAAVT